MEVRNETSNGTIKARLEQPYLTNASSFGLCVCSDCSIERADRPVWSSDDESDGAIYDSKMHVRAERFREQRRTTGGKEQVPPTPAEKEMSLAHRNVVPLVRGRQLPQTRNRRRNDR